MANDSFIHELRLKTTPQDLKDLDKRLNAARLLYNACLGEGLKRLRLVRQSKTFQKAVNLSPKIKNAKGLMVANKERKTLFIESNQIHSFTDYDLQNYVLTLRKNNWLGEKIDSLTAQKIAKRAFDSIQKYAFGVRGKPRFKSFGRISSVEGKNNQSGIRWKDNRIVWAGLSLDPVFDKKDKYQLEAYALSCKTKYVRLIKREIKGESTWYAQLVQSGKPFIKDHNQSKGNIVGLDIGPSTIAVVGKNEAWLQGFCDNVFDYDIKIKANNRMINRSLRATNPDNYEADRITKNNNGRIIRKLGKNKKNSRPWVRSRNCIHLMADNRELSRKMAASRNTAQGYLANKILKLGNIVKTEKLSYKGFQKLWGKSVGKRSPATFMSKMRYKAENAGGVLYEFSTYKTALSQTCVCGNKEKKPLKQRWHYCSNCGAIAQRDLFSANLARYVDNHRLDISQAKQAWAGVDTLLAQAVSKLNKTATGKSNRIASFGLNQSLSCLPVKEESTICKTLDVVGVS
jgi:putative transposase